MMDAFKIEVSETANARAEADFGHVPKEVREVVAAFLTLLEGIDAKHAPVSLAPADFATATVIAEMHPSLNDPHYVARKRRDWIDERTPIINQIVKLTAYYPKPVIITRADADKLGIMFPQGQRLAP